MGPERGAIREPAVADLAPTRDDERPATTQERNVHNLWKNLLITKWGREVNSE